MLGLRRCSGKEDIVRKFIKESVASNAVSCASDVSVGPSDHSEKDETV